MQIVFLRAAESDLLEGYATNGDVFYAAVDVGLEQLKSFPELAAIYQNPHRRLVLTKVPFGIYYAVHGQRIVIAGILHLRQDPETIKKRLK